MFEDIEAERTWRRYRLRAELILGAVSRDIRRQLIEDLTAHVRESVAQDACDLPEAERVRNALARLGDPADFVAPLIADAVVKAPPRAGSGWRAALAAVAIGGARAGRAAVALGTAGIGALMGILSIGNIVAPDRIGVFRLSADDFQVRLLGLAEGGGDPVLAPWLGLAVGALGAVLMWRAASAAQRLLSEIMMDL